MDALTALAPAQQGLTVLLGPHLFATTGSTSGVSRVAAQVTSGCAKKQCSFQNRFGTLTICADCTNGTRKGDASRRALIKHLSTVAYRGGLVPVPQGPLDNLSYCMLPETHQTVTQAAALTLLNMDRTRDHEQRIREYMEQMFPTVTLPDNFPDLLHSVQDTLRNHVAKMLRLEDQLVAAFVDPTDKAVQGATEVLRATSHPESTPTNMHVTNHTGGPEDTLATANQGSVLCSRYPDTELDCKGVYHLIIYDIPQELQASLGTHMFNFLESIRLTGTFVHQKNSLIRETVCDKLRVDANLPANPGLLAHLCIEPTQETGMTKGKVLAAFARVYFLAADFTVNASVVGYT